MNAIFRRAAFLLVVWLTGCQIDSRPEVLTRPAFETPVTSAVATLAPSQTLASESMPTPSPLLTPSAALTETPIPTLTPIVPPPILPDWMSIDFGLFTDNDSCLATR